ncbi:acyltransferase 3 [Novosphingobium aromaticivorans DSM 12444]|uniref:Acyltransferase 3 n=1 Tax=Novosphingobium aromaticivorans (strain ATCC 700278 / DSM 12444 / CCUG 56034 / CIP 105152 / NBRC 16084 / F199) TaxID=279238 RepID=Q2G3B1_NOVAD|nr:acyltransferase [Novosphingobium aromaticivorans]ABD27662.1 acyltransferase 3 [Novosphingobium aromaticivorans DSM 12444]
MTTQDIQPRDYIPSLDGWRAVSIAIVFLAHAFHSLPVPGGFGVTVFFFISGYLITTLLVREYAKSGTISFLSFYIRRFFRLAPPLLLTMTLAIGLVLAGRAEGTLSPVGLASQVFFFFNYWDATARQADVISGTKIFWSLSVEEHFYFIFPATMLLILKRKASPAVLAAVALVAVFWRIVKFSVLGFDEWQIYALTDTRFDSMLWGSFLAVMMEKRPDLLQGIPRRAIAVAALGGGALILLTFVVRDEFFRSTFRYTVQGVSLVPIFYYSLVYPGTLAYRVLNSKIARQIGVYSYTFYLCHYIILNALIFNGLVERELVAAVWAGSLALAYSALMYHFVELPVRHWRSGLLTTLARSRTSAREAEARP